MSLMMQALQARQKAGSNNIDLTVPNGDKANLAREQFNVNLQPLAPAGVTYEKWIARTGIEPTDYATQLAWIDYYPHFAEEWKENISNAVPPIDTPGVKSLDHLKALYFTNYSKKTMIEQLKKPLDKNSALYKQMKYNRLLGVDYDSMRPGQKLFLLKRWKFRNPDYTKNRMKLYNALMRDNVGTPYANMNNILSHLTANDNPPVIGKGIPSDEDNYYDVLIPEAATILDWYNAGKDKHSWVSRFMWYRHVAIPRAGSWASRKVRNTEDVIRDNKYAFITSFTVIASVGLGVLMLGLTL